MDHPRSDNELQHVRDDPSSLLPYRFTSIYVWTRTDIIGIILCMEVSEKVKISRFSRFKNPE